VERLAKEFRAIAQTADLKEQIEKLGMIPVESDPPAELRKFVVSEAERWGKVVHQAGLAGTL
jgi:tripartite-type tricarboxylate transporter receptor subunit TctC